MTVEQELRIDWPAAHLRGWFLRPREKNSCSACATTAEIVTPASRACWRTRATRTTGSLTVNTVVCLGRSHTPGLRRTLQIAACLPDRAPEPPGQAARGLRRRDPRFCQLRGRVDTLGVLTSASAITRHDINVLPAMSLTRGEHAKAAPVAGNRA